MVKHVNFYENVREAEIRLNNTIVMYDEEPCYILGLADHKDDGIIRAYLDPLRGDGSRMAMEMYSMPVTSHGYNSKDRGILMDQWLETNDGKKSGVLRKMMNSPKFDRFRPFPLGNMNIDGMVAYLERRPTRYTQQGLIESMISCRRVCVGDKSGVGYSLFSKYMYDTIKGNYPSAQEALEGFNNDSIANEAVAFHRYFAFVRGPLGIVYLAYKNEIVGFTPDISVAEVRLGKEYSQLKETLEELNVFHKIV